MKTFKNEKWYKEGEGGMVTSLCTWDLGRR